MFGCLLLFAFRSRLSSIQLRCVFPLDRCRLPGGDLYRMLDSRACLDLFVLSPYSRLLLRAAPSDSFLLRFAARRRRLLSCLDGLLRSSPVAFNLWSHSRLHCRHLLLRAQTHRVDLRLRSRTYCCHLFARGGLLDAPLSRLSDP